MSINKENKDWFDTHFEVVSFDADGKEDKETANKLKEGFKEMYLDFLEESPNQDPTIQELESRVCSCGKLVEDCDEAYEHATSGA